MAAKHVILAAAVSASAIGFTTAFLTTSASLRETEGAAAGLRPEIPVECAFLDKLPQPGAKLGPADFPPGQWERMTCGDRWCNATSQLNAFRYDNKAFEADGVPRHFHCGDWEEAVGSDEVVCTGYEHDDEYNRTKEIDILCPSTRTGECSLLEVREVFVPSEPVTLGELLESSEKSCQEARESRSRCSPWCGGESPDPACRTNWDSLEDCSRGVRLRAEAALKGEGHIVFYDSPSDGVW